MILAISTASEKISIALYKDSVIEKELKWVSYRTQSRELLPEIAKLLEKNRCKLGDIRAVAVYSGPGSYTGLRVGVAIANTLSWSLNIPVIGIKGKKDKNIEALDLAKKADKILNKKSSKFDKIVVPSYGTKI